MYNNKEDKDFHSPHIPEDSAVFIEHKLSFSEEELFPVKGGYLVNQEQVFEVSFPNGSKMIITTPEVRAGVSGQKPDGGLGYGILDPENANQSKYSHEAYMQTVGNTAEYGIPSNHQSHVVEAIDLIEDTYGVEAASKFDGMLKDFGRRYQVDTDEPDLVTLRDHTGNLISSVSNITEQSAQAHMFNQMRAISNEDMRKFHAGETDVTSLEDSEFQRLVTYINDDGRYETKKVNDLSFEHSSPTYDGKPIVGHENYSLILDSKSFNFSHKQIGTFEPLTKLPQHNNFEHSQREINRAKKIDPQNPLVYDPISTATPKIQFRKLLQLAAKPAHSGGNTEFQPFDSIEQFKQVNGVVIKPRAINPEAVFGRAKPPLLDVQVRDLNLGNDLNSIGRHFHRYSVNVQPLVGSGVVSSSDGYYYMDVDEYKDSLLKQVDESIQWSAEPNAKPFMVAVDEGAINQFADIVDEINRRIIDAKKENPEVKAGVTITNEVTTSLLENSRVSERDYLIKKAYEDSNYALTHKALSELKEEVTNKKENVNEIEEPSNTSRNTFRP